jgi:hypothetical protein
MDEMIMQQIEKEARERVVKAKRLAAANGISYIEGLLMEKRLRQAKANCT